MIIAGYIKYLSLITGSVLFFFNSFNIEKVKLNEKYLIKLTLNVQDSGYVTYTSGESLKPFTELNAAQKINLIEKLLSFESDTSVCYNKVYPFWPQYYRGKSPVATQYQLQIEALHMINFIAFTDLAYSYSPYPVLYCRKTKKEITCHSKELSAIFLIYKEWFQKIKKKGFVNYRFPLANTNYQWFGSLDKEIIFKTYPVWAKNAAGDMNSY